MTLSLSHAQGAKPPLELIRGSLDSIRERPARRRWKDDVELGDAVAMGGELRALARRAGDPLAPARSVIDDNNR